MASVASFCARKTEKCCWKVFQNDFLSFCSSLATGSTIESETEGDNSTAYGLNHRRCSSGNLLSPEVDMAGATIVDGVGVVGGKVLGEASETDGFYMLKKDSQRRTTLSKVLSHDEAKICAVWMDKIENNHKVQVVITQKNLEIMIRALRDYIMEQNKDILQSALGELKLHLDFDSTAIDHLQLALFSFQVSFRVRVRYFNRFHIVFLSTL